MGATFKPFERRLHETTVERAAALCDGSFGELVERGARLSLAEAVELGRAEPA
jgi:hypothetical protein